MLTRVTCGKSVSGIIRDDKAIFHHVLTKCSVIFQKHNILESLFLFIRLTRNGMFADWLKVNRLIWFNMTRKIQILFYKALENVENKF